MITLKSTLLLSTIIFVCSVSAIPIEWSPNVATNTTSSLLREARQEYISGTTGQVIGTQNTATNPVPAPGTPGATGNQEGYLYSTYANVGQILNGVFDGDIAPILAGGAAFIPAGELRKGVSALLTQQVAPQVQRIFRDVGATIQRQFNGTTPLPTLNPGEPNPIQYVQAPTSTSLPQSQTEAPVKTTINISNPLQALQSSLQSSSSQTGGSPFENIRSRLQSLIPVKLPFPSSPAATDSNTNDNNSAIGNSNYNKFRNGIPLSPID